MINDTSEIFYGAWREWTVRFPTFFEAKQPGMRVVCAGIPVPLFNCAFPNLAVRREGFARLMEDFSQMLAPHGLTGLLMSRVDRLEAPPDTQPVVRMPGMVAGELEPSKYPAMKLDVREVRGEKMAEEIARLNVICHGMPEDEIAPMTCAALWAAPNHGFLIYDGENAAAAGSVSFVNGASYVGWMATHAEYRGRGYAEAILRHMDAFMRAEYGVTESVLHATESGRPVYERVGYRLVDEFVGYLCGAEA